MHHRSHAAFAILAVAALSLLFTPISAPTARAAEKDEANWVVLGQATVPREGDEQPFNVNTPDVTYTKIRFRVHGPAVHFAAVLVVFADGQKQQIDLDKNVLNDQGTGPLDLKGGAHHITRVVAKFATVGHGRGGEATVTLWGLK